MLYLHHFFLALSLVSFVVCVLYFPMFLYRLIMNIRSITNPVTHTADILPKGNKVFLPFLSVCLFSISITWATDNLLIGQSMVDATVVLFAINAGFFIGYFYLQCTRKE